jgi:pimeloyl-ACP methyl ester carboxylesterase
MASVESASQRNAVGMRRVLAMGAIGIAVAAAILYIAALVALYTMQRNLLFVRGREEWTTPPIGFSERIVREKDGTRLRIWESQAPQGSKPTIVFFYGNAGTLSDYADIGEALRGDGYGVVLASYRGFSGNPGAPSEAGLFADARAILAALPRDHGPIVLWGQSLGSGVAAQMASEGRGAGLILLSPYTAVVDLAAVRYPLFPVRLLDRDPFDTMALVPKIRMPVLIMHGTDDHTVPFAMGERLASAFGSEAQFVPLLRTGHGVDGLSLVPILRVWLQANAADFARIPPPLAGGG